MHEYFIWIDGQMICSVYSFDTENVMSQALKYASLYRPPYTVEIKCDTKLFKALIVVNKESE